MWAKTSVLLVLMILSRDSALISAIGRHPNATQQVAGDQNLVDQQNKTAPRQNATNTPETLEVAPTITSVHHQVWTSSSSGRLDELSPEVISKLRNDVPFLAAYALRPRLVGAPSSSLTASDFNADQQQPSLTSDTKFEPGLTVPYDEKAELNGGDVASRLSSPLASTSVLQVGASSPRAARQSLVPKLGEFSEFKVETSSLSKSEHHHKRRTSLKRPEKSKNLVKRRPTSTSSRLANRDNGREDSLSQLVKRVKLRRSSAANNRRSSSNGRGRSRKSSRGRRAGSRRKSKQGKRRRASRSSRRSSRSSSRSSRFLQQPNQPDETNELETADLGQKGTKGGDVKGGSGRPQKTPFYAVGQRPKVAQNDSLPSGTDTADSNEAERNLEKDGPNSVVSDTGNNNNDDDDDQDDDERTPKANGSNENNNQEPSGLDNDDSDDDEIEPMPKRVGDDDVEEDGDTVLVEPKSDGVDDDPPLPSAEDEAEDEANGQGGEGNAVGGANGDRDDSELPTTSTSSPSVPQGDPRGNRVNRQKPNELPASGGGQDQVVGGGVGATVGGGGGSKEGVTPTDGADKDQTLDDGDRQVGGGGRPKVGGDTESGVEFADDERRATASGGNDARGGRRGDGSKGRGFNEGFDDRDSSGDGNFGERNKNDSADPETESQPRSQGDGGTGTRSDGVASADEDKDLDYRDEMERTDRKLPTDGPDDDSTQTTEPTTKGVNSGHGHSKADEHCDDGSYDHGADHHHHHHDTIDWLRGSIPGEPNEDYPILSRVNATNFSCADQKHPGYYADVDARCQIFHICQADGRQDSFLCPNGTIFSQRSLVCVWWNGFHCEDAPKFYHLNELLYKSANGNESPQTAALPNLRPLDGAHLKPRSMMRTANDGDELASADEDNSPIDGLMRGRRPHFMRGNGDEARGGATNRASSGSGEEGTLMRGLANAGNNIGPDDDATIQRKSTNLDDDSVDEPQARLRARNAAPRRRRRASTRQAPPKLKSRRVSRNSRRRKLRHGIKPRRRA